MPWSDAVLRSGVSGVAHSDRPRERYEPSGAASASEDGGRTLRFGQSSSGKKRAHSAAVKSRWARDRPAAPALAETLPEAVSAAATDFITGSLIENPRRVGRELRNELAGIHSARRGSYRVLYRIDERERTVTVLRIDHQVAASQA